MFTPAEDQVGNTSLERFGIVISSTQSCSVYFILQTLLPFGMEYCTGQILTWVWGLLDYPSSSQTSAHSHQHSEVTELLGSPHGHNYGEQGGVQVIVQHPALPRTAAALSSQGITPRHQRPTAHPCEGVSVGAKLAKHSSFKETLQIGNTKKHKVPAPERLIKQV